MPTERVFAAQPLASAGGRVIVSPFQFATDGEDNLRIVSANSLAGVRVALHGRRVDERGRIVPFRFTHTPNTDRTQRTEDFVLGAGALLNLTVFPDAGAPVSGQCYVMVQLIRGFSGATIVLGTLLAGYVQTMPPLGWPGSPIESSISGPGYVRVFSGTDPAAATEASDTVPTGARWELLNYMIGLTTSGTAGARYPRLCVRNSGVFFTVWAPAADQGPSATVNHIWSKGISGKDLFQPDVGPGCFTSDSTLLAGLELLTNTVGMAAGDNFGPPRIMVREWIEV